MFASRTKIEIMTAMYIVLVRQLRLGMTYNLYLKVILF